MAVSTLVRGWGPSWLCSLQMGTISLAMAAFALVESSSGARGAGTGAWYGLGGALGWSWQASQSPRQFSICCLHAVTGSEQVYVCALQELSLGFLQVLFKPAKELIFPVLNPGLGCLIYGSNPSLPRGDPSTSGTLSSSGSLTRGMLLLPSYQLSCGSLYIGLVVEELSC